MDFPFFKIDLLEHGISKIGFRIIRLGCFRIEVAKLFFQIVFSFKVDVPLFRSLASKKMMDVFNREQQEIKERIEKMYDEYNTSIMVWESKISFEPIVGKSYFLYNFAGELTLSLIAPNEWIRGDDFVGEYLLNSDNKWIKQ